MALGGVDTQFRSIILQNEYRIAVLERVVELLIQRFPLVGRPISESEMQRIRQDALEELKQKYPGAQIALKQDESSGR